MGCRQAARGARSMWSSARPRSSSYAPNWITRNTTIRLCYEGGASFAYGLDGTFFDRDRWIEWSLKKGDLFVVERMVKEKSDALSAFEGARLIAATDVALERNMPDDQKTRALACKLRGICFEALGNEEEALRSYDMALAAQRSAFSTPQAALASVRFGRISVCSLVRSRRALSSAPGRSMTHLRHSTHAAQRP
jgi:hypothetical protein